MKSIKEYFEEAETTKEYDGYYYQVADIISIVVLGSLCGLKNPNQLHQWATSERTRGFLRKELEIERIPCHYWFFVSAEVGKSRFPEPVPDMVQALDRAVLRNHLSFWKKHSTK